MLKRIGVISIILSLFLISCANTSATKNANAEVAELQKQIADLKEQVNQNNNDANQNKKISAEEAKKIAVRDANLNENDVAFVKVNQDNDDGILNWEIEFVANNAKYEYEINANDGSILKFEKKSVSNNGNYTNINQNATNINQNPNVQGIDVEKAKSIAVQNAGLDINNVTFIKQKYDIDDGIAEWEIEFVANNNKYEYEISALDGTIMKSKLESINKN